MWWGVPLGGELQVPSPQACLGPLSHLFPSCVLQKEPETGMCFSEICDPSQQVTGFEDGVMGTPDL